jgi:hypothetical protein
MHINFLPPNKGLSLVVPGLYQDFYFFKMLIYPMTNPVKKKFPVLSFIGIQFWLFVKY